MFLPSANEFHRLAQQGNLIPVYREILADMETPVSAFRKIDDGQSAFLLESIEGGEKWARYSFLGSGPVRVFRCRDHYYEVRYAGELEDSGEVDDPLHKLRELMAVYQPVEVEGLPRFFGGAVGYLGYDMIRFIEDLPDTNPRQIDGWDACFMFTERLLIFDNMRQKVKLVYNVHLQDNEDSAVAYQRAQKQIERMLEQLRQPLQREDEEPGGDGRQELEANFTQDDFKQAVERCKKYIRAGDIFQVVLSRKFSFEASGDYLKVYEKLRSLNPSPYLYHLKMGKKITIGSSPEMLLRVTNDQVETFPIAGTRKISDDETKNEKLRQELVSDEKELAEHTMLVDLGRNDIGKVCDYGTVRVNKLMEVKQFSHVQHMVTHVVGKLNKNYDMYDAFKAVFPAGTVSGAPKVRAMEIIDELEPESRGPYAGAVGYFSFNGCCDFAIAIRSIFADDKHGFVQAGAGIVFDSIPDNELKETEHKANAMITALLEASK